jgi:hypothetical protein
MAYFPARVPMIARGTYLWAPALPLLLLPLFTKSAWKFAPGFGGWHHAHR